MTVCYAQAAARVLESLILTGASGGEAVRAAAAALHADANADGAQQLGDELEAAVELARDTAASNLGYLDGVIAFCGGRYNAVTVS